MVAAMINLPFGIASTDLIAMAVAIGLLLVDFVLGAIAAWQSHTFAWDKLPSQFETLIRWNLVGLSVAALIQGIVSGSTPASDAVIAFIVLWAGTSASRSLVDIQAKLIALFGGTVTPVDTPTVTTASPP